MTKNVGGLDRMLRIVAGIAILMFVSRTAWAWLGLVPLLTGMIGSCPLYRALGWSTLHKTA